MKYTAAIALAAALGVQNVAAHATFQDLWINGVDQGQTCVRLPQSNSPVTDVSSNDVRCNVNGAKGVTGRCAVKVGDTLSVEMHQQGGQRDCGTEAIGGAHYGPVHVYMSKVSDARTADGSAGWFKVYADAWSKGAGSSSGDNDNWGTKDMNKCCGHVDFKVPAGIPNGDYLVRAEAIALHSAASSGGAQLYMSCCEMPISISLLCSLTLLAPVQVTVSGGGTASPPLVQFPGAYKASDPVSWTTPSTVSSTEHAS